MLPGEHRAPVAEAWGGRAALALIIACDLPLSLTRVCGDNLGVIRHCSEEGRLIRAHLQEALNPGLHTVSLLPGRLTWQAVPRTLNCAADKEATAAKRLAMTLGNGNATWTVHEHMDGVLSVHLLERLLPFTRHTR